MSQFINKIRLQRFQWILIFVLISSPFYTISIGPLNLYYIYTFLFVLAFFYNFISANNIKFGPSTRTFLLLIILSIISDAFTSRDVFQANKVMILTLLVLIYPCNKETSKLLYPSLAYMGVGFGIYMYLNPEYVADVRLSVKMGDWIMDPNWAAIAFFPPFCYGLSLISGSTKAKFIGATFCVFALFMVFLTGSRGALLSLLASLLLFFRYGMKINQNTIVFFSVIVVTLYFLSSNVLSSVDEGLLDRYNGTVDDTGRSEAWSKVFNGINTGNVFQLIFGHGSIIEQLGIAAHNIFLQQLYEKGIFGLILLLLFLYRFFRETLRCRNYTGLFIFVALVVSSFFSPLWGNIFMMMPFAAIGYMNNCYKQRLIS